MENQQVILVTGTSSGFGNYIVKTMALAGYTVAATMRDIKGRNHQAALSLKQWAAQENVNIHLLEMDVTNNDSVDTAMQSLLACEERIDIVVNNAGVATMGYAEAYSTDQLQYLFNVNVFGSNRVILAALPTMRRQKSGLIIQISSLAASLPMPFHGNYPAAKLAVETIAETYRYELAPFGIDVVIIQPGGFPTALIDNVIKPAAQDRVAEYGELADLPEKIFAGTAQALSGPDAPSPRAVADAVKELVEMPFGKRPLRTIVDKMGFEAVINAARSVNNHNETIRAQIMEGMRPGK